MEKIILFCSLPLATKKEEKLTAKAHKAKKYILELFNNPVGCLTTLAISRLMAAKLRYFSGCCSKLKFLNNSIMVFVI
jgi:hypothetical protein